MSQYGRVHLGNELTIDLIRRVSLDELRVLGVIEQC